MASRKISKSRGSLARKRSGITFNGQQPAYLSESEDDSEAGYDANSGEPSPSVFDPVTLVPTKEYYKATSSSSRVAGFQFVPMQSRYLSMSQFEEALNNNDTIEGALYVWWVKGSNISKYGPMTLAEYEDFRDSPTDNSYGRAILNLPGYVYDVGVIGG